MIGRLTRFRKLFSFSKKNDSVFLDKQKFGENEFFTVYESQEVTKMRIAGIGLTGFFLYNTYNYIWGEEELDKPANLIFGILCGIGTGWIMYKSRKTVIFK